MAVTTEGLRRVHAHEKGTHQEFPFHIRQQTSGRVQGDYRIGPKKNLLAHLSPLLRTVWHKGRSGDITELRRHAQAVEHRGRMGVLKERFDDGIAYAVFVDAQINAADALNMLIYVLLKNRSVPSTVRGVACTPARRPHPSKRMDMVGNEKMPP